MSRLSEFFAGSTSFCNTVNLLIFVATIFGVLPMECQFAAIHFHVCFSSLITYNGGTKVSW